MTETPSSVLSHLIVTKTPTCVSLCGPEGTATASRVAGLGDLIDFPVWYVNRVLVHPDYRRKGYGRALLATLVAVAWEQSALPLVVTPGGYGTPTAVLLRLYLGSGFQRVQVPEGGLLLIAYPIGDNNYAAHSLPLLENNHDRHTLVDARRS